MNKPLRDLFYRVLQSSAVPSPPPSTEHDTVDILSTRWCCGPLDRPSHLLAFSVLQIKVRVEVDHNSLIWLWSLNQPFTFLAWVVSIRIARRGEIPWLSNFYIFTTFICNKNKTYFLFRSHSLYLFKHLLSLIIQLFHFWMIYLCFPQLSFVHSLVVHSLHGTHRNTFLKCNSQIQF